MHSAYTNDPVRHRVDVHDCASRGRLSWPDPAEWSLLNRPFMIGPDSNTNHYLWLLSTVFCSADSNSVVLWNGSSTLRFESDLDLVSRAISRLDGTERQDALLEDEILGQLIPLLDEEGWLVRMSRPLRDVVGETSALSRQLAYYAQLQRVAPESALDILAKTTVAIVGVGGVGGIAAQTLAGSGVGNLILMDPDVVDASNMNRQLLYQRNDVGRLKVEIASEFLRARHQGLTVETHAANPFLDRTSNAALARANFILFAGDSDTTLGDGALPMPRVPIMNCGYVGALGIIGPVHVPGVSCWRCGGLEEFDSLSRTQQPRSVAWNCSGAGINGIIGSFVAERITRFIVPSLGEPLDYDQTVLIHMESMSLSFEKNAALPLCSHFTESAPGAP